MLLCVRLAALAGLAFFALNGLAPSDASATPHEPTYLLQAISSAPGNPSGQWNLSGYGTTDPYPDENGVVSWDLGATELNPFDLGELGLLNHWSADLKEDPFVTNNINITNDTAFNVVYIASVVMPIPAFAYDEIVFSSVGVTATDSNGNNIMLVDEDGGLAFYRGRVNGNVLLPLTPPAIPITTADCSPTPNVAGCTATSAIGVASMAVAPDVANNIEIILRFVLSPGDSVGITSRFEIVPEPTPALLVGLGLLGLALVRRHSR